MFALIGGVKILKIAHKWQMIKANQVYNQMMKLKSFMKM